jgi:hypothetical protein
VDALADISTLPCLSLSFLTEYSVRTIRARTRPKQDLVKRRPLDAHRFSFTAPPRAFPSTKMKVVHPNAGYSAPTTSSEEVGHVLWLKTYSIT